MNPSNALLGLLAETPIHAGAGHSAGAIDLPIQREAHTDWPCVYGSAVKGALRARAEQLLSTNPAEKQATSAPQTQADPSDSPSDDLDEVKKASLTWAIFGPDTQNASDHAGALLVGDARLALLPVRSLTGHFKWLTCPALLRRLRSDLQRLGSHYGEFELPKVNAKEAWVSKGEEDVPLFLEEFNLTTKVHTGELHKAIAALASLMPDSDAVERLQEQLAVVDDDLFGYLARFAVPVAAHVRIDNKTKTVQQGALWYEETLPPETLFYVALSAWDSRNKKRQQPADELLAATLDGLFKEHPYLQLGGNETVGMGWCRVQDSRNLAFSAQTSVED